MSAGIGTSSPVVAIGGGHGLAATLRALRAICIEPTAVVSVADDGGSTGRLRADSARPAPGDIRKCLVALAGNDGPLTRAMEHRFDAGEMQGHSFGNLMIAALEETEGSLLRSVEVVAELLGCHGQVLPATEDVVELVAELDCGREVTGQAAIASTPGVHSVELRPRCEAPVEALDAVARAETILLGPGSLYTSVLAAAMVPSLRDAVGRSQASLVYLCNLRPQAHETDGYDVAAHVDALARHGFDPDVVLYDPATIDAGALANPSVLHPVSVAA
ncbi:MAG: uridine diphosphate-N-acetylglucosamine-binding protein YvcK, partial [Microthrixaceae bacterium]